MRETISKAFSNDPSCPPDYYYGPAALNRPPELFAETLYVIGGLYGNPEALAAVLAMKAHEELGGPPVKVVFNGDFNWFNVDADSFREINEAVLEHTASFISRNPAFYR